MTLTEERPTEADVLSRAEQRRRSRRRIPVRVRSLGSTAMGVGRPASGVASKTAIWALLACSFVALWSVFFALVLSSLQQHHNQHNLYSQFREQLGGQVAPLGGGIAPGAPVALISMPSAGITDAVVTEGTAAGDLAKGPGHRRDTPLPGQAGVSVVYGRARLFAGPFKRLANAKTGDSISVVTGQGKFTYLVERVRHVGEPFSPILADGESRLTLTTAEASGWRSGWAPSRTVYVDAKLRGKVVGTPDGRPASVPAAETAMKGDVGSLFSLVLWIPLLVLACLAVVWASVRWGRWQTWIAGAPVVVAALWGVTETAVQLLPNLM